MNSQSECYEPMLRESLQHFLVLYRNGNSDFSGFESIFFRLIQSMPDPPLEIAWFYSAVIFHRARSTPDGPANKMVLLAKELFQLLISCSNWSNGLKKIALLAPVVYQLYNSACDSNIYGSCLRKEVEDLVEKVVSYANLCCHEDSEKGNESNHFPVSFEDLIRVWTINSVGDDCKFEQGLRVFFPLLSDDVRKGMNERCSSEDLAQFVLFELFVLRLCLKFDLHVSRDKLQISMQNFAVQMIGGFQNCCFIDMLLRMLLQPTLPVASLLSSEDVVFLRRTLYDTVILFDYSFIYSRKWTQLQDNQLRNLAVMWSLVADTAVQFARDTSDQRRAVSYVNAFLESQLSTKLIKWVSNQAGGVEIFQPNTCTPEVLIRWLRLLEHQGIRVFDHNISTFLPKEAICRTRLETNIPDAYNSNGDLNGGDFEVFNKDQEMVDSLYEGRRKRKEGLRGLEETRTKHVRYDPREISVYHGKFGSGNEIGNPVNDEDMEVKVTG